MYYNRRAAFGSPKPKKTPVCNTTRTLQKNQPARDARKNRRIAQELQTNRLLEIRQAHPKALQTNEEDQCPNKTEPGTLSQGQSKQGHDLVNYLSVAACQIDLVMLQTATVTRLQPRTNTCAHQ